MLTKLFPAAKMLLPVILIICACMLPYILGHQAPSYTQRLQAASDLMTLAQADNSDAGRFSETILDENTQKLLHLRPAVIQQAVLQAAHKLVSNRNDAGMFTSEQVLGSLPSGETVLAATDNNTANWTNLLPASRTMSLLCVNHTADTMTALLRGEMWALQMLDAAGKPTPGLLEGNINWPGAYDFCRKIRSNNTSPNFAGQYCTAQLVLSAGQANPLDPSGVAAINMGLCAPDSCSGYDMSMLLYEAFLLLNVSVPQPPPVTCTQTDIALDAKAVVAIVICSIILALMILGTAADVWFVQRPKWQAEEKPNLVANGEVDYDERQPLLHSKPVDVEMKTPENSLVVKVLLSFSVYTNGAKLLSTNQSSGSLTCIHGIRFLSMTWVVLGHAFLFPLFFSMNTGPYLTELLKRWTFQAVANAFVSVDSFFTISGLLVAYLSLKEMQKRQGKLNWFLFYFHRFWRLTPPYMLIIMVYTCLSPYWGEGPLWPETWPDRDNCKKYWWANLLYINNLVRDAQTDLCLAQSWYLANDMQFYILSPLIFVPLYFSMKWGLAVSGVFLVTTAICPGVLTYRDHFPPGLIPTTLDWNQSDVNVQNFFTGLYTKPYNRMGPYVIGMLAGYFLYRTDCKLRINKFVNLTLWAVATASALAVLYGLYDAYNGHPLSLSVTAFYNAVNKQVWALCLCWVIIACVTGNGGFVNSILSWKALIPLSRLTYCIYLLHIMIAEIYLFNMNTPFYMSDLHLVFFFLALLVVSYMAAAIASLSFEAPMMALEKVIFQPRKKEGDERKL